MKRARLGLCLVFSAAFLLVRIPGAMATVTLHVDGGAAPDAWLPGHQVALTATLSNSGDETATTVTGTLSSSDAAVTVDDGGPKSWPDIAAAGTGDNADPFTVSLAADAACGGNVSFTLDVTSDQGPASGTFDIAVACPNPDLTLGAVTVHDPATDAPLDALTAGDPAKLKVGIANQGSGDATNVQGHLTSPSPDVEITDATAGYGTVATGGEEVVRAFALTVHTCDAVVLHLGFDVASDGGAASFDLKIPARCPGVHLTVTGITLDDSATGNGDGYLQPGEDAVATINARNDGRDAVTGLTATLSLENMTVTGSSITFGDIAARATGTSSPFHVRAASDAPTSDLLHSVFGGCSVDFISDDEGSSTGSTGSGTVSSGSGAATNGDAGPRPETSPVEPPTPVVLYTGTLHVTAEQGEQAVPIKSALLCALAESAGFGTFAGGGTAGGDDLARTGAPLGPIAAAGVVFLLMGGTLIGLARRRADAT